MKFAFILVALNSISMATHAKTLSDYGRIILPVTPVTAVVVFFPPASGEKGQQEAEAKELAESGVTSFLYEPPYRRFEKGGVSDPRGEVELWQAARTEFGWLSDELVRKYPVAAKNLILVGKNLGGAVAAYSMNDQVNCLIASGSVPISSAFWTHSSNPIALDARKGLSQEQLNKFIEKTAKFDLIRTLGSARASILIQFGTRDPWTEPGPVSAFQNRYAGSFPISYWDDDHTMNSLNSVGQRQNFILECIQKK